MAMVTRKDGYVQVGKLLEHRIIIEAVLGHALPPLAESHHVNDCRSDNRTCNLVVLQDKTEHRLLEMRRRIYRAGGRPFLDRICYGCRQVKPIEQFSIPLGRSQCRVCAATQAREWRAAQKERIA